MSASALELGIRICLRDDLFGQMDVLNNILDIEMLTRKATLPAH